MGRYATAARCAAIFAMPIPASEMPAVVLATDAVMVLRSSES